MEQNTTIIALDEELWNLNSHHHISTVNAQCTRSVQQCDHYFVVHHEQEVTPPLNCMKALGSTCTGENYILDGLCSSYVCLALVESSTLCKPSVHFVNSLVISDLAGLKKHIK